MVKNMSSAVAIKVNTYYKIRTYLKSQTRAWLMFTVVGRVPFVSDAAIALHSTPRPTGYPSPTTTLPAYNIYR